MIAAKTTGANCNKSRTGTATNSFTPKTADRRVNMKRVLLTVCAFGLLLSSASAQETLSDTELWRRDGLCKKAFAAICAQRKITHGGIFHWS